MTAEPKPIRNEADYELALDAMRKLWGAATGSPEQDRLGVWATLVDDYETRHFPIDKPDPIDAIRFRMEQAGLTRKDLEPIFGSRARVAEVLNGKRGLSVAMIRRLHAELNIPVEILIQETHADRAA